MARPLGSGPIHVYIAFGPPAKITAASARYFGTTRQGPDIDENLDYYPVMNDLTGPKQSMDDGYAGREDLVSLVMSSWDQATDNMLEHFLDPLNQRNPRGTDGLTDLGTLMISEGFTIGLWLLKQAATKAVNVASGMPLGRFYPTCVLVGPNKLIEGNRENLHVRIFRAKKDLSKINQGQLPLFREDNASFNGLPSPTFG
jgi:hypothetical protein